MISMNKLLAAADYLSKGGSVLPRPVRVALGKKFIEMAGALAASRFPRREKSPSALAGRDAASAPDQCVGPPFLTVLEANVDVPPKK